MGWGHQLLDGRWWGIWTSQLLHGGPVHILSNLAIIGYCGFRVEQALGRTGLLQVMAASVLGGSVLVLLLGRSPVAGSSILGFGLWGAQIAVGFRWEECIPPALRSRYGWGNLAIFAPLYAFNLQQDGISQLGHLGALLGGLLLGLFSPPPGGKRVVGLYLFCVLFLLGILPGQLWRVPSIWAIGPMRTDAVGEVSIPLPSRMVEAERGGLSGWSAYGHDRSLVYVRSEWLGGFEPAGSDWMESDWATRFEVSEIVQEESAVPWRVRVIRSATGDLVIERSLQRGSHLLRVGCWLDASAWRREAACREWLSRAEPGIPSSLRKAKSDHESFPYLPRLAAVYANLLYRSGDAELADGLYGRLSQRDDLWAWEGPRQRILMRAAVSWLGAPQADRPWLLQAVDAPVTQERLPLLAAGWLAVRGDCEGLGSVGELLRKRSVPADWLEELAQIEEVCAPAGTGGRP
jgi:rhomboid protease GluP